MDKAKAIQQLSALKPFEFCHVKTNSDKETTAVGSYVVNDYSGKRIFARRVCLLTRELIETEHFLGDEYADVKEAFETHYSPEFIVRDCIILSLEVIRDHADYDLDSFPCDEKYGEAVYYADVDFLRVSESEQIERIYSYITM